MDITQLQLESTLLLRVAKLEAENIGLNRALAYVAQQTRNSLGTITAVCFAITINIGASWLHDKYQVAAYDWMIEHETMLATDVGVRIREIIDFDTNRFVALPSGVQLIGLTPAQTQQWIQELIRTESSGNQTIVNQYGYMGIGQFGASALVAVGLVSKDKFRAACKSGALSGRDCWKGQKQWLKNNDNWLIDGGMDAFLNNKGLQIAAIVKLANLNIQDGYRMGAIHRSDSPQRHGGYAKASHLVGSGNAAKWYKYHIDTRDGNGNPASNYARQGERCITS
ncbi:hypothetical protein VSS37_17745 [Candidatus Thiothrix sp. Deng01]|uniref:Uncharacterized protein n=1 Tax=Candidatus Thiothrix phosphatis TaxID=3112415 RepID=A0ABU6D193_9GAMM|nr:hypothetical protein [Candidatus Thiothrix sp. Deng01]MEB4592827.1 hypothetical protein [Candidatus Thiothrix sp. Deng01]